MEGKLKIVNAYERNGWYVIVRKMNCKKAHSHARRKQVKGKVVSKAICKKGIWYCVTKVKQKKETRQES